MDETARDATLQAIGALTGYLARENEGDNLHGELVMSLIREHGVEAVPVFINGLLNVAAMLAAGAAAREGKTPTELLQGIALALEAGR